MAYRTVESLEWFPGLKNVQITYFRKENERLLELDI